ncbi:MAG TPA: efflux RND transporter periplasmic adaptor subunit, partial [Kofleriaceae bacterium]|nr:efflux RND transporter periplasmic adaptor subunit [Kofleriaceae bacterium]
KTIIAEVDARIEKVLVTSGQTVAQGDPIAELDTSQIQEQVAAAQGNVDAAKGQMAAAAVEGADARRRAELEQRIYRSGGSSREAVKSALADVAKAGAAYAAAKGQFDVATAQLAQLQKALDNTRITAPIGGVVAAIKVAAGEMATRGTPIAQVFDVRDLLVRFAVPRKQVGMIKVGQPVTISFDGDQPPLPAVVQTIGDEIDPALEVSFVEADIDDASLPPERRKVGIDGKVRLAAPAAGAGAATGAGSGAGSAAGSGAAP